MCGFLPRFKIFLTVLVNHVDTILRLMYNVDIIEEKSCQIKYLYLQKS